MRRFRTLYGLALGLAVALFANPGEAASPNLVYLATFNILGNEVDNEILAVQVASANAQYVTQGWLDGSALQQWEFYYYSDNPPQAYVNGDGQIAERGQFVIINKATGLAMSLARKSTADGVKIVQAPNHSDESQTWGVEFILGGSGFVTPLLNVYSRKYLVAPNQAFVPGLVLQQSYIDTRLPLPPFGLREGYWFLRRVHE